MSRVDIPHPPESVTNSNRVLSQPSGARPVYFVPWPDSSSRAVAVHVVSFHPIVQKYKSSTHEQQHNRCKQYHHTTNRARTDIHPHQHLQYSMEHYSDHHSDEQFTRYQLRMTSPTRSIPIQVMKRKCAQQREQEMMSSSETILSVGSLSEYYSYSSKFDDPFEPGHARDC